LTDRARQFETVAMPHLDAAYNLARWLVRDEHAAEDAVQESFLRALRYFDSFRGDAAKPWLLGIVRNTCFDWLRDNRGAAATVQFDEELDHAHDATPSSPLDDPLELLAARELGARLDRAIEALPVVYREALILREQEELSYADIARIGGVPVGTVMSRLSRARRLLRSALVAERAVE